MDEFIAKENIKHFRKKLASETDEAKCKNLCELLAEEEAKLAKILAKSNKTANK